MIDFREEIKLHYTDPEGMITGVRDPQGKWTSGNHLLITGTYFVILSQVDVITKEDIAALEHAVRPCEVEPGRYNRNAGRPDRQAHDDYIGVAAGSAAVGSVLHDEIVAYGSRHWWYVNNQEPFRLGALFWRFPGLVSFFYAAAGKRPSLLGQLVAAASIAVNAHSPRGEESGTIMNWLKIQSFKGKGWLLDLAISYWKKRLFTKYPQGMGEVFEIYYGKGHPFSLIMQNKA